MLYFPISHDKIILWYTSSHFFLILPFSPSPIRRERFYSLLLQRTDMAELLDFCFQFKQGQRKERFGGGCGFQRQGHVLPIPPPVPEVRAFPGVSNLTKDRGPQAQQQQGTQVKALCRQRAPPQKAVWVDITPMPKHSVRPQNPGTTPWRERRKELQVCPSMSHQSGGTADTS